MLETDGATATIFLLDKVLFIVLIALIVVVIGLLDIATDDCVA